MSYLAISRKELSLINGLEAILTGLVFYKDILSA